MSATPAIVGWRHGNPLEHLLEREWLVTNGLGGYASGSLSGGCTRRYHGALVAALPAPHGRTVFVPFIDERLTGRRGSVRLSAIETTTETCLPDSEWISEIGLECGLPVWRYRHGSTAIEKTIAMPHLRNATCIQYRLTTPAHAPIELELRPYIQIRAHEASVTAGSVEFAVASLDAGFRITHDAFPDLVFSANGGTFTRDERAIDNVLYRVERGRGYDHVGRLTSPGCLRVTLRSGQSVTDPSRAAAAGGRRHAEVRLGQVG